MIQSVEIKGLRGIREGKLSDLTPLVVLVGPNGCGKSTILEALLIGASPYTQKAIATVFRRHEAGGVGPRWLFWRAGLTGQVEIVLKTAAGKSGKCSLHLKEGPTESEILFLLSKEGTDIQQGRLGYVNHTTSESASRIADTGLEDEINLVEAYSPMSARPLPDLFTDAVRKGRRKQVIGVFKELVCGFSDIEILTENGQPILHFVFDDHSVPATLAGDGIKSLLRQSLELVASSGGVALLEEPEVHEHPGAIRQCARAILAAVRRQIQVILATHSLELIDALIAESSEQDLTQLSLYNLQLENGVLRSSRLDGPDIAFSRTTIEEDLR